MKWTECRVIAFDTETTGLNAHLKDRIIEFGAVELQVDDNYQVVNVRRHHFMINPEMPIPREASNVSGIRDEDVRNERKFFQVATEIWNLLENSILVAHNFAFDFGFLRSEFRKLSRDWPKTLGEIDTLSMARKFMGDMRSKRLENIATELGVPLLNAHRAVDDAEACGRVFVAMAAQFTMDEEEGKVTRGRAPLELRDMLRWAQGYMRPPENEFIGLKQSGVPEFLSGEHAGALIEDHQDYLEWMVIAKQRRNGQWESLYSQPLREWISSWLAAKSLGGNASSARGFGAKDWQTVEPLHSIYEKRS